MDTFIHDHDAHGATAVNMFKLDCEPDKAKKYYKSLRQIAKVINFLLMYGGGAFTLFNTLSEQDALDENVEPITKEKAQEYYDMYFEAYAGVAEFIKNQKKFAHRHEMVYTLIGRKRRLPDINSGDPKMVGYQERLAEIVLFKAQVETL
jgi:DNA polymerase-1